MNGIIAPGQLRVETTYVPGPLAFPATVVVPQPTGVRVVIIGGMSKVEMVASQFAAKGHSPQEAVELARRVLEACGDKPADGQ